MTDIDVDKAIQQAKDQMNGFWNPGDHSDFAEVVAHMAHAVDMLVLAVEAIANRTSDD